MISLRTSSSLKADISYANLVSTPGKPQDGDIDPALTSANFSTTQIDRAKGQFVFKHQTPNTESGFSAALIQDVSDTGPQFTLAIRGTDQLFKDVLVADLGGIVFRGAAFGQIVDLYNYWMRLTAPKGANVDQVKIVRRPTIGGGFLTAINTGVPNLNNVLLHYTDPEKKGIGAFEGLENPKVVVTGHSLGGHLATAFQRLFPEAVDAVLTFNSAGTRDSALVNQFFDVLAGRPTFSDVSKITNFYGSSGLNFVAGEAVYDQIGQRVEFYTEGVDKVLGHGISPAHDSLAVHELLLKMDSSLNSALPQQSYSYLLPIFKAAHSEAAFTLETVVNAVGRLLLPDYEPIRTEEVGQREALFSRIYRMLDLPQRLGTSVERLTEKSVEQLVLDAKGNVAHAYALLNLNPFAVIGEDYSRFSSDLALGPTGLSDAWITARAEMLEALLRYNRVLDDKIPAPVNKRYEDALTGVSFGQKLTTSQRILFGGAVNEVLSGGQVADKLFGGGGDDVVNGLGGDDIVEGGAGSDTLLGGAGNDRLIGGTGFDTYRFSATEGNDAVVDADGSGRVLYGDFQLTGGERLSDGVYRDASGAMLALELAEGGASTLVVDGVLRIEGFTNNALGIHLQGAPEETSPLPSVTGENHYSSGNVLPDHLLEQDPDLSPEEILQAQNERLTHYLGSKDSDQVESNGLLPVFSRTDDDQIVLVEGSEVFETIDAGAGNDIVDARLSLGSRALGLLAGGGGSDFLFGGDGDDALWGDNYIALLQSSYYGTGQARFEGVYEIDGLLYRSEEASPSFTTWLEPGEGGYPWIRQAISNQGDSLTREAVEEILIPDGVVLAGSLGEVIDAHIGTDAEFNDFIDAGDGNDVVIAGSGHDDVYGGGGNDYLVGDYRELGNSTAPSHLRFADQFSEVADLFGLPGNDHVDGGEGDDELIDVAGGDDTLIGGAGNDTIQSREGFWKPGFEAVRNVVEGGDGDDFIDIYNPTGGLDQIDGGAGDDRFQVEAHRYFVYPDDSGIPLVLSPAEGRVVLEGGSGNDQIEVIADAAILDGGEGDDSYVFRGNVLIRDSGGNDSMALDLLPDRSMAILALENAVSPDPEDASNDPASSVYVRRNGNDLEIGFTGGVWMPDQTPYGLRLDDWFAGTSHQIENILTPQGSMSTSELENWGSIQYGSMGHDTLASVYSGSDIISAYDGDDRINAGAGDDRISGGRGDDTLNGGEGNDLYYYSSGDGKDLIQDSAGVDTLKFGPGIVREDVQISVRPGSVFLMLGSDRITLASSFRDGTGLELLQFSDGRTVDLRAPSFLPPRPRAMFGEARDVDASSQTPVQELMESEVGIGTSVYAPSEMPMSDVAPAEQQAAVKAIPTVMAVNAPSGIDAAPLVPTLSSFALAPGSHVLTESDIPKVPVLDLRTVAQAVDAFERNLLPQESAGTQAGRNDPYIPNTSGDQSHTTVLTANDVAHALLRFEQEEWGHDLHSDAYADQSGGVGLLFGQGAVSLETSGTDLPGASELHMLGHRLQSFRGLQEGLRSL